MIARLGALGAVALVGACTFAGLADYTVATCDPRVTTYAEDDCRTLDGATPGCWRHQCNPQTSHCEIVLVDDDHDGDPAARCGGGDCDDADPRRSHLMRETCDGVDNDCDGVVDDATAGGFWQDAPATAVVPAATAGFTAIAATSTATSVTAIVAQPDGSSCIHVTTLPGDPFKSDCTLLGSEDISIVQPFTVASPSGGAFALFVKPTGCGKSSGQLSFRNGLGASADLSPCNDHQSFPAFAVYPDSAYGVAVFASAPEYLAPDAQEDCGTTKPADLSAVWVRDPYASSAAFAEQALFFARAAVVTRAPELVSDGHDAMLFAAPDGDGVSIWELVAPTVGAQGLVAEVAHLVGPTYTGATDVRLALRTDVPQGAADDMALLVQRRCTPGDASLVIGSYSTIARFLPRVVFDLPAVTADAPRRLGAVAFVDAGPFDEWRVLFAEGSAERMYRVVPVGDVPGIATQSGYAVAAPEIVHGVAPLALVGPDGTVVSAGASDPLHPEVRAVGGGVLHCR